MIRTFLLSILTLLSVLGPRQDNVLRLLSEEPALKGVQVSILAVRAGRDTLVAVNPEQRCVPASNMKLVTSGVALKTLGADYRFETALSYSGAIRDSILVGDLYIVGGADPTIDASYGSGVPADTVFRKWTGLVREAGIRRIEGRVIGDSRFFDGSAEPPSWSLEDLGMYYGATPGGLNFHENVLDADIAPGLSEGDKVLAFPRYPEIPHIRFRSTATASPAGRGDNLWLYNSDLAPVAQLRGSYPLDRPEKTVRFSNRFAALSCAGMFRDALSEAGVTVLGGYADITPDSILRDDLTFPDGTKAPEDSLTLLGSTLSPRLAAIIGDMERESDNFYAETLFRMVGKTLLGSACYDSSYVAVCGVLRRMGVGTRSVRIYDGSGLSRKNSVSASFFVSFLSKMLRGPESRAFVNSLPRPGTGTLTSLFRSESASLRSRLRMKSGSMGGVRCYSGYILPESGPCEDAVVFSVLVNDIVAPGREATRSIEKILLEIAR